MGSVSIIFLGGGNLAVDHVGQSLKKQGRRIMASCKTFILDAYALQRGKEGLIPWRSVFLK